MDEFRMRQWHDGVERPAALRRRRQDDEGAGG
jgi:hypothetical protein